MTIRLAKVEDAAQIAMIHVAAWKAAYAGIVPDNFLDALSVESRETGWRQHLLDRHPVTWVAEESGTIIGWISAAPSRDGDASAPTGEIWAVYVAPEHWAKGVGRALCDTAEGHLRQQGFIEVTLWVLRENLRAVQFYHSNGFVLDHDHERTSERGGKSLQEIRFRKLLIARPVLRS